MRVSLIQFDIRWESPPDNLAFLDELLKKETLQSDLLVLPEMFSTGFSMNPALFGNDHADRITEWMQEKASRGNYAVCGSVIAGEKNGFYNRFCFVYPDGKTESYDKRHLFRMGGEEEAYMAGTERKVISFMGFRILLLICYDLRFPVWSRNRNDYDFIIYTANWPAPRSDVWNTLLKARAIENQAYVAGVNRIGTDGRNIAYTGESQIISPKGEILGFLGNEPGVVSYNPGLQELREFRAKFPAWEDADDVELNILNGKKKEA